MNSNYPSLQGEILKLDLNFPDFQKDLFKLERKELYALIKTLRTFSMMDFDQLRRFSILNMEKIKTTKTRKGNPIYSIRITRSFRATLTIEGDYLRFIYFHPDHDSAYKTIVLPHNAPLSIVNN